MSAAENTPRSIRPIITLIGCRNVGKSSLMNALTEQDIAIVSAEAGTTTDAVAKPYELLPFGPVTFYDTAGLDDDSTLGVQRIAATCKILFKTDLALLVIGAQGFNNFDKDAITEFKKMEIPFLIVFNQADISQPDNKDITFCQQIGVEYVIISALQKNNINKLKNMIISTLPSEVYTSTPLLGDLINAGDKVILITPIDSSAPKGRLILPQVQVLRELADLHAISITCQPEEIPTALAALKQKPRLVITDSQAIFKVNELVPQDIELTTFSILFARAKGDLRIMYDGAQTIDNLHTNANILIAEACSHHAQDDDIAKVKIPNWLKKYTQKQLNFTFCTGCDFPADLENYDLVIHCGACMLNRTEMKHRLKECVRRKVKITNYGVAISKAQGILSRVVKPFGL